MPGIGLPCTPINLPGKSEAISIRHFTMLFKIEMSTYAYTFKIPFCADSVFQQNIA